MCARPFTLLKAAFDPLFPLDSIIMYEHDGTPDLGFISGMRKERYLVTTSTGSEIELTKMRLHKVPGSFSPEMKSKEQKISFLHSVCNEAATPVELDRLWSQCEQQKIYNETTLSDLLFCSHEMQAYVHTRFALIRDRVYFKRDKEGFIPRTQSSVDQLITDLKNREAKIKLFEETAQFFREHTKEKSLPIPEHLIPAVDIMKDCAAYLEAASESKLHEMEDLVTICERVLHMEPHGIIHDRAFHILYKAGIFKKDVNLSIIRYKPKTVFDAAALKEAEELTIPASIDGYLHAGIREDLTKLQTITIDDESTQDMDDALSLVENERGFTLYIHISDVASMIPKGSALDTEAFLRATSIYCPDSTISMLPDILCKDKLSLVANAPRPSVSYIFEIDRSYNVLSFSIIPSLIQVSRKYSYTEVDGLLEKGDVFFNKLHSIAATHEGRRLAQGATPVAKREAQAVLLERGEIKVIEVDEHSPARALIGEVMVLANCAMASFFKTQNIPALYRCQEAPDPIDEKAFNQIPQGPARDYAERGRLKRSIVSIQPGFHATLGVSEYLQCTSPIRRYLDLVLQRQLLASLQNKPLPYSTEALTELSQRVEEPLQKANLISRETKRYWLIRYLEKYYLNTKRIKGTVVRTDTKMPMVELNEVFIIAGARIQNPKLGAEYLLAINHADPRSDYLRLEEVKPKQNRF